MAPRRGMRAATVTAVMGDGEGGGVGRVVRSEIAVSRMSDGERTLSTKSAKSAVSTATLDVANMAVVVVSGVRYPPSNWPREEKEGKEGRIKGKKEREVEDEARPGNTDA